jgi:SAM-dependent methyltransferase
MISSRYAQIQSAVASHGISAKKKLTMTEPQCLTMIEPQFEQSQHRSPPLGLRIKPRLSPLFRPHRKIDFLNRLPSKCEILDVGCGSNSPYLVKSLFPDFIYTGIDVEDYRQTKPNLADHYVLVDRHRFSESVLAFGKKFDAVISSHNLEHCDNRDGTLDAMMTVLKDGGRLYISFPSETSVTFPSREGCLNYYDDPTHKSVPPDFDAIVDLLSRKGFSILYSVKRYQPPFFWTLGLVSEPISKRLGRMQGTWEYYGFESIIWAQKRSR